MGLTVHIPHWASYSEDSLQEPSAALIKHLPQMGLCLSPSPKCKTRFCGASRCLRPGCPVPGRLTSRSLLPERTGSGVSADSRRGLHCEWAPGFDFSPLARAAHAGDCPVPWKVFSSIPGLPPPDGSSILPSQMSQPKCLQTVPGAPGGQSHLVITTLESFSISRSTALFPGCLWGQRTLSRHKQPRAVLPSPRTRPSEALFLFLHEAFRTFSHFQLKAGLSLQGPT